ncbi:GNAT family N-acetyltransferase [Paenibacillus sp. B2(2019)]|uniref:GNAT family N-acetyltransferase n=1 Tax=Paenibacillus sp. B2(2019) TaxID=2607754 RepID=UPI0011F1E00C|nr:GNAT family N-acetyltransferase [Paenibacillus sp. B2(2019)]KAA1190815.1 GNAT family N-acetyltransferase [Paenibacillus sp. B2(2019)]
MYKAIEEITLNTWPAEQSVLLNGWVLRTAAGYTKRANSVNPLYGEESSLADLTNQIKLAEQYYKDAGLKPVFKITPYIQPANLDEVLAERGYTVVEPSSVRLLELEGLATPDLRYEIQVQESLTEEWLNAFTKLSALSKDNRSTLTRMLSACLLQQGYILLFNNGVPTACGLGVIQNGYIGLFDIITASDQRRQGMAEQLLLALLHWGKTQGATTAFLQVVQANTGASALYDKLEFKEIYQYWYRV